MPEDFGLIAGISPEEFTGSDGATRTGIVAPVDGRTEQNLARAEAAGLIEQIRTIAELEPDLAASDPEFAFLAKMTPEDLANWPGDMVGFVSAARQVFSAFALTLPELVTYVPPVFLTPGAGRLVTDYLHVTGLTIPWRAKSEFFDIAGKPITERRKITEDRDYAASLFLVIEIGALRAKAIDGSDDDSLIVVPQSTVVKRVDAGRVRLYSRGDDFRPVLNGKGFFLPNPPGAPVFSDRYKTFPEGIEKGEFNQLTHTHEFDPLAGATLTPEKTADLKLVRSQFVNDVERRNFDSSLLLKGGYIPNGDEVDLDETGGSDIVYTLLDSFVVLEPVPAEATESSFIQRVAIETVKARAEDLIKGGIDAAALSVGGPFGLALSVFGKVFFSEFIKDLQKTGANADDILTVSLDRRAYDGAALPKGSSIIPTDRITPHSKFLSPIGTKPELWAYGSVRTRPFSKEELPTVEDILKVYLGLANPLNPDPKLFPKTMRTRFDLAPSVRLVVRRAYSDELK